MQRYYFDINDGRSRTTDTQGQEVESFDEARRLAVQELALIIRDEMPDGERESYVVTVRNARREPVYLATAMMLGEIL